MLKALGCKVFCSAGRRGPKSQGRGRPAATMMPPSRSEQPHSDIDIYNVNMGKYMQYVNNVVQCTCNIYIYIIYIIQIYIYIYYNTYIYMPYIYLYVPKSVMYIHMSGLCQGHWLARWRTRMPCAQPPESSMMANTRSMSSL